VFAVEIERSSQIYRVAKCRVFMFQQMIRNAIVATGTQTLKPRRSPKVAETGPYISSLADFTLHFPKFDQFQML
jgi:hypothetical protein